MKVGYLFVALLGFSLCCFADAPTVNPAVQGLQQAEFSFKNKDYRDAFNIYQLLANDQKQVIAQYQLGYLSQKGLGTEKNLVLAAEWYKRAADTGFSEAQFALGICYFYGLGVTKDIAKAITLFHQASNQNNLRAE